MARYWSCASTHPHNEGKAIRNLRRQNFNAFYPFLLVENRFKRFQVQPVFANYVFIELDDTIANWAPINSTLGVKRLLTLPGKGTEEYRRPSRIGFIESLRKLQLRSPRAEEVVLPAGTMVRITRGPFAEHIALVELSTQDRVRLLLEVFSREISIDFSPDAVEIVTRSGEGVPSSV